MKLKSFLVYDTMRQSKDSSTKRGVYWKERKAPPVLKPWPGA